MATQKTLLVVDDEEHVRGLFVACLEGQGYAVLQAANGAQALQAAKDHPGIDVVVCDLMMPGLNGIQVREQMKEIGKQLPFLYISGSNEATLKDMLAQQKQDQVTFLQKPVRMDVLRDTVVSLLTGMPVIATTGLRTGQRFTYATLQEPVRNKYSEQEVDGVEKVLRDCGKEFYDRFPHLRDEEDFDHADTDVTRTGAEFASEAMRTIVTFSKLPLKRLVLEVHRAQLGKHEAIIKQYIAEHGAKAVVDALGDAYRFVQDVVCPLTRNMDGVWAERLSNGINPAKFEMAMDDAVMYVGKTPQ
ncbi:MAG: response regulator [Nanoarchaeota archaeon]